MQRLVLAILLVALAAGVVALLLRSFSRVYRRAGDLDAIDAEGEMPKISFFLLLCLIMYVSLNGAS